MRWTRRCAPLSTLHFLFNVGRTKRSVSAKIYRLIYNNVDNADHTVAGDKVSKQAGVTEEGC